MAAATPRFGNSSKNSAAQRRCLARTLLLIATSASPCKPRTVNTNLTDLPTAQYLVRHFARVARDHPNQVWGMLKETCELAWNSRYAIARSERPGCIISVWSAATEAARCRVAGLPPYYLIRCRPFRIRRQCGVSTMHSEINGVFLHCKSRRRAHTGVFIHPMLRKPHRSTFWSSYWLLRGYLESHSSHLW